jgi:DNA invertase Pin-like site-specific DNA recombinase
MLVGYARTSTTDQTAGLAAQERDLRAAGADKVYAEQVLASHPAGLSLPSAWPSSATAMRWW